MPGLGTRAVSVPRAMEMLGVSRPKIYKMISEGVLSAVQMGSKSIRITMKSIDDLLGESVVETESSSTSVETHTEGGNEE